MDISIVLSGIAVGSGFGFVLQRGRFCLNTAFRNAFYIKDFRLFRSYLLALVITVVGANILEQFDMVHVSETAQEFTWLANIIGGYLFGIGMVLAGGDAAGTWYRAGEGLVGSWIAALGIMIGASAASRGALSGVAADLESFVLVSTSGDPLTIHGLLGVNRWIVIALFSGAALTFVFAGRAPSSSTQAGYHWRTSGSLVGIMIVLGLFVAELMTGTAEGITFIGPSDGLLASVVSGRVWDWGVSMAAGVPLGSFISAAWLHEFSWRAPRADVMVQQFAGGLIMGAGGMLAGGCSIGHGLSGIATLALSSLVSMAFIVLGSWTMVYVLFMRGPSVK
jgi:uncharacterized membrane protein YedE/YeeE